MADVQAQVGPSTLNDGNSTATRRFGRQNDLIVSELHGKYYEQNVRGNVFKGLSASTGIALIVPATTGGHPTLWNPLGSGVVLSICRLMLTYVSGANAPTALEWASTLGAGAAAATGSPILTATLVAPTPGMVGGSGKSKALWAPTVNTFTAAPLFFEPAGISLDTMVAASTNAPFTITVDYDGLLPIAPGNALSLCSQAATTTALFQVMVVWEEIPV
jgi:hypothetical protein